MAVRSSILDMFSTHTEPTAWNVPPLWSDTAENHSWSFARTTLFLPSQLERRNTQALSNTALSNFNWKYWNKSSNRHCRANQWLYRHSAPRDRGETEATGGLEGWKQGDRARMGRGADESGVGTSNWMADEWNRDTNVNERARRGK